MPADKSFEHSVPFRQVPVNGRTIWLPLVTVSLIQADGNRVTLPLLFDTGASKVTLRHDLYPILGVAAWDAGSPIDMNTAGGAAPVTAYEYRATLEFLGKSADCPILLTPLPQNPLYVGLFGREGMFDEFGFGFWESTHELHVTTTP